MKKYKINQLLSITVLVLTVGCGNSEKEEQENIRPVKMFTIENFASAGERQYPGRIEANKDVALAFELNGKLMEFPVQKGQNVAKGDLIAQIDPERYKNDYLKAQADYNQSEKDFQRNQTLYQNGAISASELDSFLRARDVAKATLKTARRDLNDTVLRAPFAGVIALKPADNFENITSQQEIVRLQDLSLLLIKVNVPEAIVGAGNEGRLTVDQLNERLDASMYLTTNDSVKYDVYLKDVETDADPATRTYEATFALETPEDANILPGMTAVVIVKPTALVKEKMADIKSVYMIPTAAIAADPEGKSYVLVVNPETMQVSKQIVQTGEIIEDKIQILDGLETGVTIVAAGVSYLREETKVRALEANSMQ
ncbi:MAG: efflux RND transporter periplasmic adaptor subunit [Verrucomicrobiota bacterium]